MELVRVLPSAEDEVNVACFHPFAGGGLVYGTKASFYSLSIGKRMLLCIARRLHLHCLIDELSILIVGRKASNPPV